MKNGKGKEYDNKNGHLIFKGEYINDKKMEKEKLIMIMKNYNLKENIIITSNIMVKNIIIMVY